MNPKCLSIIDYSPKLLQVQQKRYLRKTTKKGMAFARTTCKESADKVREKVEKAKATRKTSVRGKETNKNTEEWTGIGSE